MAAVVQNHLTESNLCLFSYFQFMSSWRIFTRSMLSDTLVLDYNT